MVSSSGISRPSSSPSRPQLNNVFKNGSSTNHGGNVNTSSSSGGMNNKSVVFNNKMSTDPCSPTTSSMPLSQVRGGATTMSSGGSLALRGGGVGVGPRLRAEGLMVPPASDAATLRRQVAALQIDLEAHIDGEQRLQSINHELRERLNEVNLSLFFDFDRNNFFYI